MTTTGGVVQPITQVTQYTIYALPLDLCLDAYHWSIKVEWRAEGKWAIKHMSQCLGDDGQWDWEPSPSNREDDWLAHHRFDEQTALRLAQQAVSDICINGQTPADLLAKYTDRTGD